MRLRSRLKEWVAYRAEIRRTRREYRNVRRDHIDHAESARFRARGEYPGGAGGGIGGGGADGGGGG